jgi:hypothetical protein
LLEDAQLSQLTDNKNCNCSGSKFSSNGQSSYCKFKAAKEQVYNLNGIGHFEGSNAKDLGEPRVINEGFDRSVNDFEISDTGADLSLTVVAAGRVSIYSLPAKGRAVKTLSPQSRGVPTAVQLTVNERVAGWEISAIPAKSIVGWYCRPNLTKIRRIHWCSKFMEGRSALPVAQDS